ncbi:hypothetical protein Tsubulata_013990 [Turnera subulata]|uniref:Receptor-like serine/threonine-protein kinase n=1 Tax=Turnera subulata TaxID=218843 RepID=A0A9Q0IYJ5_9ROSI|nr:hypothetical protein Tsubulata_013990 [Turnera subulata]
MSIPTNRLHTIIRREHDAFVKFFLCSFLLSSNIAPSFALDSISPGVSVEDGDTIVSERQNFELGFFSPGSSTRRYLGIWYKRFSRGTVIWVANRETPLLDHSGLLRMTDQGVLVLQNSTNYTLWSSPAIKAALRPVARLLDTGNLVVKDESDSNTENYLWQSFDNPTHTFLPGMKIGFADGLDLFLSSWKSSDDPARGDYTYLIDRHGFPQNLVKKGSSIEYRVGPWNGVRFTGAPRQLFNPVYTYGFVLNEKEAYYHVESKDNNSAPSRFVLDESGQARRLVWLDKTRSWGAYFTIGEDRCDKYLTCGAYARCNINDPIICSCFEGFEPKSYRDWSLLDWSGGCVRKTPLTCGRGEGFVRYTQMKLPDTSRSWYNMNMNLQECEDMCLRNCSCTAYTSANISGAGSGCLVWFGELTDMRVYPDSGQELYVRMSASYLEEIKRKRKGKKRKHIGTIVGFIIGSITISVGVFLLGSILYVRRKKYKSRVQQLMIWKLISLYDEGKRKFITGPGKNVKNILEKYYKNNKNNNEDLELPVIQFSTIIKATQNFSTANKLGKGGFGPVYKGTLSDGQDIAVKRLEINSGQGLEEFINEVILIVKLQHRNLVKLLGCCVEGDERMLVYEYMPNKSLDYFIFGASLSTDLCFCKNIVLSSKTNFSDESKSRMLDWQRRINIISGIARGLMYLHQDSRLRIIHRDLKASNILLDYDMNPKISDFGMARICRGNQTEANTHKVVGTYGYIAPEYAVKGRFSVKSDTFSFGVLVLEIISGIRNTGFSSQEHQHNLLGHAWKLWMEGRPLELVDDILGESDALSQIQRCIHIGLLCVQNLPNDRPNMSNVVLMLESQIVLPQPKQPGFFVENNIPETESSSSTHESGTKNETTATILEPR